MSQQLDAAQRSHGFPDVWQQQPFSSRPSGAQTPPRESATALGDAPYVFAQPAAAAARGWRRAGAPAAWLTTGGRAGAAAAGSGAPPAGWWGATGAGGGRCGRSTA